MSVASAALFCCVRGGAKVPALQQHSHPAIVSPEVWELVQIEIEDRKIHGNRYSGKGAFASRIVCGDCGGFYGSKVWHSTDRYRRTIWRCNRKDESGAPRDQRCTTPHVTEFAIMAISQLVCLREDGALESPSTVSIVCRNAKKRIPGLEDFHFHMIRHTYTTNLLANGAASKDEQELLGHSDITTTMGTYAHATRETKRTSARLMDKVAAGN